MSAAVPNQCTGLQQMCCDETSQSRQRGCLYYTKYLILNGLVEFSGKDEYPFVHYCLKEKGMRKSLGMWAGMTAGAF